MAGVRVQAAPDDSSHASFVLAAMLITWVCAVALALLRVSTAIFLAEGHLPLGRMWVMGLIHIPAYLGTALAVPFGLLEAWSMAGLPWRRALSLGFLLFCALAFYTLMSSLILVKIQRVDEHGVWTFLVPGALAVAGFIGIRRAQR